MPFWKPTVKSFIEKNDPVGLDRLLDSDPSLANKGVTIPFEFFCRTYAHPLQRICDAVFAKKITDQDAVELAKVLIRYGSRIEGNRLINGQDPPILAAASLHAEQFGIFLLELGADPHIVGSDGASALHWACFCGRDKLVKALISHGVEIDLLDSEHQSTPLKWALHCLMTNDQVNKWRQKECIEMLIAAGANTVNLDPNAKETLEVVLSEVDL